MDQYLTTYEKDYTWPLTRIKRTTSLISEHDSCRCRDRPREIKPLKRCGDDFDWSRISPMGRLLDPKLYPAKTGPYPETEATRFDQPGTYMRKLEEKYPNLYGILQSTPMDEIIRRVDEVRLKTTYQLDYSDPAATQMEKISMGPCAAIQQQVKDRDCRPSALTKSALRDKDKSGKKKTSRKTSEDESQETRLPPWRSEYQDTIHKLGQAIMKHQIHHKKKKSPIWAMAAS